MLLQEDWPEDEDIQKRIQADFCADPKIGDRRQELVFIGQDLKVGASFLDIVVKMSLKIVVKIFKTIPQKCIIAKEFTP
jgi:hypothetical protein